MNEEIILEEEAIAEEQSLELARVATAITMRPIRGLPTLKPPICVPPTVSVREAVERMNEHSVGCVLVETGGRLVGVFTERDVLTKIVQPRRDIDATRVADVMTADPECLTP